MPEVVNQMPEVYKIFNDALRELDSKLKRKVEIRAIGGYAVLHHTQIDRFSKEIDSYSRIEFTNEEEKIIEEIGEKYTLDSSWLNYRWAASTLKDEIFDNAKWEKIDIDFKNIDFYVVSVDDLLESKFRACNIDEDDEDYVFRGNKDLRDIFTIANQIMKIKNYNEMENKLSTLFIKYPITVRGIKENQHYFKSQVINNED